MKLSSLTEMTPLDATLRRTIGRRYFATNKAQQRAPKTSGQTNQLITQPQPISGFQGGNYGALISGNPRLEKYFGGKFGT
jgi:hypothetical protein